MRFKAYRESDYSVPSPTLRSIYEAHNLSREINRKPNFIMSNHTPLQSFLQNMLRNKSNDNSMGTAKITIVMDNASPAMHHRRRSTSKRFSLDVSDHARGKSRWVAESRDQGQASGSILHVPPHIRSPRLSLTETSVIECDSDDEEGNDGLLL